MKLYEILVPTVRNDGRPIHTRFHRVWDDKVVQITGGLTVMPATIRGTWIAEGGDAWVDRMIPVRIACEPSQMHEIALMTGRHYDQLCIMYYKISDEVTLVNIGAGEGRPSPTPCCAT